MTVDQLIDKILSTRTKAQFKATDALLSKEYPNNADIPLRIAQALEAYEMMRLKAK